MWEYTYIEGNGKGDRRIDRNETKPDYLSAQASAMSAADDDDWRHAAARERKKPGNEGSVETVVYVTSLVPRGAGRRIDEPAPGNCGF